MYHKKQLMKLCKSLASTIITIDCGCDTELEDIDILEEEMRIIFPEMFCQIGDY